MHANPALVNRVVATPEARGVCTHGDKQNGDQTARKDSFTVSSFQTVRTFHPQSNVTYMNGPDCMQH